MPLINQRVRDNLILSLDKIKLFTMILLVASLPFSGSLKLISLYLMLFVLFIQLYKKETKIEMSATHYGFLLLILSGVISSIFAESPIKSLKGVEGIFYYTIAFFVASSITDERHVRSILWGLYISTAAAVLIEILRSIQAHSPIDIHPFGNLNYIAMVLIIIVSSMLATILFSDKETKLSKIILLIFASLLLIASVMTVMRASFISLFMFIAIILFRHRRLASVKLLSLGFFVLTAVSIYFNKPMLIKFFSMHSLINRTYIWGHALNLFKQHPFTGVGLNHFKYIAPAGTPEAGGIAYDAHNLYLQTASQMGLPGLVSLLVIGCGFLYKFFKSDTSSKFVISVQYGALGGFLVTFASGIFDTTLHRVHAIAFTLLAGLMFGLCSKKEKSIGNP